MPTLVIGNGYDAVQEDSYHNYVAPALARDWNCITYEGPGQPTVVRNRGKGFIPQWEHVVILVVDYVLSEKKDVVDEKRLPILGNSFGGYLAARAVAFEHRLSAAVLIDGIWDLYVAFAKQFPSDLMSIYEKGDFDAFDEKVLGLREAGKFPTMAAWGIDQGLWSFRTHSPSHFFNMTKEFHLKDVVHKINVPMFVGDSEFETVFMGQPPKVKKALGDKGTLHTFKGVPGYHCQTGAGQEMSRTIFTWLHKTLGASEC